MSRQFTLIIALVLLACVAAFRNPVQAGRCESKSNKHADPTSDSSRASFHFARAPAFTSHNVQVYMKLTIFSSFLIVAAKAVTVQKMSPADVVVESSNLMTTFSQVTSEMYQLGFVR